MSKLSSSSNYFLMQNYDTLVVLILPYSTFTRFSCMKTDKEGNESCKAVGMQLNFLFPMNLNSDLIILLFQL